MLLAQPLSQGLGKISYGLYLWHWPLLVLAPYYFQTESLSLTQSVVAAGMSLWAAIMSYVVLEDPVRSLPSLSQRPWRGVVLGTVLVFLSAGTASAAFRFVPDPRGTGATAEVLAAGSDIGQAVQESAAMIQVPSNLSPALSEATKDEPGTVLGGAGDCHMNLTDAELSVDPAQDCVFGDPHGAETVMLVGDSHAFQWLPTLDSAGKERGWRIVVHTKAACPIFDVKLENTQLKRDYAECYSWRERLMGKVTELEPDLVVTTGAVFNPRSEEHTADWIAGTGRVVSRLRAGGVAVALVADTPYQRKDVPKCLSENLSDIRGCSRSVESAMSDPQRRTGMESAAKQAGATVINPLGQMCTQQQCPVIVENTLVYRDNSHLTATFARTLAPYMADKIEPLLGRD
ncbi:MAG: hypothetical protein CSB46_07900 [Micrococcales bacterium]|nr:MAG: hypothetical protein CSB46_07900 [Micrococcales bacterium]